MVKRYVHNDKLLALVLRSDARANGVDFLTTEEMGMQSALMGHPMGKVIQAHEHKQIEKKVSLIGEVLIIREGKLRVDLYDDDRNYLESFILGAGDIVVLPGYGGHGFKVIEKLNMVEIKQGPYNGALDKVRYDGIRDDQVTIKE
jgi:mannose-6-phosphate isomerase-like protein (cupin superfamily)